jgi:hypothetical protein
MAAICVKDEIIGEARIHDPFQLALYVASRAMELTTDKEKPSRCKLLFTIYLTMGVLLCYNASQDFKYSYHLCRS